VFLTILLYRDSGGKVSGGISLSVFRQSLITFVSDRLLFATALVDLSTYFAYGALETYLPLFLQMKGFSPADTGIIFSVQVFTIALTKPLLGKAADRVDKRKQIAIGLFALGGAVAAIPFASGMGGYLLISIVTGLAISTSTIATTTYTADIANKKEIGASMGALSSIMDIGQTAGPLLTGFVVASAGYAAGFAASTVLAVAVTALFIYATYANNRNAA